MNNQSHEEDRKKSIKRTLERNPSAFHPKTERSHSKGCTCKKSRCLKNYCECYEAKVRCSNMCRCQGCRNVEDLIQRYSQLEPVHSIKEKPHLSSRPTYTGIQDPVCHKNNQMELPQINHVSDRAPHPSVLNLPYVHFYKNPILSSKFFTLEVVEAACSCILVQLKEAKYKNFPLFVQEKIVIEEFGRCLIQILESLTGLQIANNLSNNPLSEIYKHEYNPDLITLLSCTQSEGFQTMDTNHSEFHLSLNCDSHLHQPTHYFYNEYGSEAVECDQKYSLCDEDHGCGNIKYRKCLPTITKGLHFESATDLRFSYSQPNYRSESCPLSFSKDYDLTDTSKNQSESFQLNIQDVHQGFSKNENSTVFLSESCAFSTNPYFPRDIDSRSVINDKPHIQSFTMEPIIHPSIQYSDTIEEFELISPAGTVSPNCPSRREHLTTTYEEEEDETFAATTALLNSSVHCPQNPSILSSEFNFGEAAETKENIFLHSVNVPSDTVNNDNSIKRTALENWLSPSTIDSGEFQEATYGLNFSPKFDVYNL
uniref:CRC domain-containing protein n=2 Tax=Schistosoma mansoni TaxID=6183 RepID=A0A3Q0KDB2_SCHMA